MVSYLGSRFASSACKLRMNRYFKPNKKGELKCSEEAMRMFKDTNESHFHLICELMLSDHEHVHYSSGRVSCILRGKSSRAALAAWIIQVG